MHTNELRARLARGERAFGGWCTIGSPFAAEILGHEGYDYVCVDCQHGLIHADAMWPMLQAVRGTGATPVVRVPFNETAWPGKSPAERANIVFLGPPGTGKTHLAIGISTLACQAGYRVAFATAAKMGCASRRRPHPRTPARRAPPARQDPAARDRRGRLHPLRSRSREPVFPARQLTLRTRVGDRHQQQAVRPLGARSSLTPPSPQR